MDQSQNTKYNEYNEHPINKLLIDSLDGLTSGWNKLTGLFSSWPSNNSTISSEFYNAPSHDNSSLKTNSITHNASHTHSSHVESPQPKKPPTKHEIGGHSQPSQHSTQNQTELPIGALRQIDLSYVNLYNEILMHAKDMVNELHTKIQHVPLRTINYNDLRNPDIRNAVIGVITEAVKELLAVNHNNSTYAAQLAVFYMQLELKNKSTKVESLVKTFKTSSESSKEISEMDYTINLMQKYIFDKEGERGLQKIVQTAKDWASKGPRHILMSKSKNHHPPPKKN